MAERVLRFIVPACVLLCMMSLLLLPSSTENSGQLRDLMLLKERLESIPAGWVYEAPASPRHEVELRIGLARASTGHEALEQHLWQTSDPTNARYGQHLSQAEIDAHTRPADQATRAIRQWLEQHGLQSQSLRPDHSGVLKLRLTIAKAEELLLVKFGIYANAAGKRIVRATEYSLPSFVHDHVAFVQPTTHFGTPKPLFRRRGREPTISRHEGDGLVDLHCNTVITPHCLLDMYNISGSSMEISNKSRFAIIGFLDERANKHDADLFLNKYVPELRQEAMEHSNDSFQVTTLQGGSNDQSDESGTGEAALDVQYALALAQRIPLEFISVGGRRTIKEGDQVPPIADEDEPWLELIAHLESLPNHKLPQTLSISYGDYERDVPATYMVAVCDGFMRLALRGMSILVSSGDDGVGDGSDTCGTKGDTPAFIADFPANCPYVTTVGATRLLDERAAPFSGGGFSNYFSRPLYQDEAVQGYLFKLSGKYATNFNRSGRAYPDVAAQGVNYVIYEKGKRHVTSGTSASAPVFASVVALLNNNLMVMGKPPLGFLNPFLYGSGRNALRDITEGRNPGCGTDGFGSIAGWDPVTGLGTPDFGALRQMSIEG